MKKLLVAGLSLVLLAACANKDPRVEAKELLDSYKAGANLAAICVENPQCNERAGDEIRATDEVAFKYTETVTNAAISWAEAPEDQKPAKLTVFEKVFALGEAAVNTLEDLVE